MLVLLALVVGIALCYLSFGCFSLTMWSEEGRWIGYTLTALCAIPGVFLLVWFVIQVVTLS